MLGRDGWKRMLGKNNKFSECVENGGDWIIEIYKEGILIGSLKRRDGREKRGEKR